MISNVFYVPNLKCNLLTAPQLEEKGMFSLLRMAFVKCMILIKWLLLL